MPETAHTIGTAIAKMERIDTMVSDSGGKRGCGNEEDGINMIGWEVEYVTGRKRMAMVRPFVADNIEL